MTTFKQFIDLVDSTYNDHSFTWRYGQTIMNVLHGVWSEKYNELVSSHVDCYYDDGMVKTVLNKLQNEWPNE
jgi:hypothetical protein